MPTVFWFGLVFFFALTSLNTDDLWWLLFFSRRHNYVSFGDKWSVKCRLSSMPQFLSGLKFRYNLEHELTFKNQRKTVVNSTISCWYIIVNGYNNTIFDELFAYTKFIHFRTSNRNLFATGLNPRKMNNAWKMSHCGLQPWHTRTICSIPLVSSEEHKIKYATKNMVRFEHCKENRWKFFTKRDRVWQKL